MSLLSPFALLALGLVPALILLYFLKLKRPEVEAPSTLLWQKVIEDMRVNSPFQRLRRSLLLLLQLLALLAFIFALARPLLRAIDSADNSIIVLLDNSASMQAVEERGRSRLDLAKAAASKIVDGLSRKDEMMLIEFNNRARVAQGFTPNSRLLRDSLAAIEATDCPTDITPALSLAKSITSSRRNPRVVLISDGSFPPPDPVDLPVEVEYRKIGEQRPNLAITGLDIRRFVSDRSKIEMFVAVQNFSTQPMAGNMLVELDGRALDSKYISVAPQESLSQIFEAILPAGGDIKVRLDTEDALACDNQAWKVVMPPPLRRVLIVGKNTFFLERMCKASPGIESRTLPAVAKPEDTAGFSTVIWNNVPSPGIAPCHNIYLGCFPAIPGLKTGRKVEGPDILDWDHSHPVNRFIDYDNLVIASATAMSLPDQATVLLRSSSTPLIVMLEAGGGSICIVGFDSFQSNWPLLVSFPLFLSNCLQFFEEHTFGWTARNALPGAALSLPADAASGTPSVELPSGRKVPMTADAGGEFHYGGTARCGIYRVHASDTDVRSIAVNLFDREESSLKTEDSPSLGTKQAVKVKTDQQVNKEYWRNLLLAGALLLLVEWAVYHRRFLV